MKNYHVFVLVLVLLPQMPFGSRGAEKVHATVTAYTSSPQRLTASGQRASDGVVACPRQYPFGTKVKIEGKIYECQDRLNGKYRNRFDIWKPNKMAARAFGKRRMVVVVVSKPESRSG